MADMNIARRIVEIGQERGLGQREIISALATGLVESGLRNLNRGDRDSLGVFQQRPSQGWGSPQQVRNVDYATNAYFDRIDQFDEPGIPGWELAARIQRPAQQFRGRYQDRWSEAENIYRQLTGGGAPRSGVDASMERRGKRQFEQPQSGLDASMERRGRRQFEQPQSGLDASLMREGARRGQALESKDLERMVTALFSRSAQMMRGEGEPSAEGLGQQPEEVRGIAGPLGQEGLRLLGQEPPEVLEADAPSAPVSEPDVEGSRTPDQAQRRAEARSEPGQIAWGGHQNGRIPLDQMMSIDDAHWRGSATHYFRPDAGQAFEQMRQAAAQDGVDIRLTDSYRSYEAQERVRREKGDSVATATPGTSRHGWGIATDVAGDDARTWIQRNGARFGWIWPEWAQRRGTKSFEPWHFEYLGAR